MRGRPLTLQPSTQQIDGIDDASADRTAEGAHEREGEVAGQRVLLVLDALGLHVAVNNGLLEGLEGEEVDRRVREHSYQSHREASVVGAEARRAPHFSRRFQHEFVAFGGTGNGLHLCAELQGVERVDHRLGNHACQAAGDELRRSLDVFWIVVAFKPGYCALTSLCQE